MSTLSKLKKSHIPINQIKNNKFDLLLTNPLFFAIFMIVIIFSVLIYYRFFKDEFIPFILLGIFWIIFWIHSDNDEYIMLILPSFFGFIHELIGVKHGYFTYLNGIIGGAPLWLIPGYGAIFWSSYHMWNIFYKKYNQKTFFKYIIHFIVLTFIILITIDFFLFDLNQNPFMIMLKFFLVFLLFRNLNNIKLAYFVAFFTVLTELTGEILGTWYHPTFSVFSLMSGYVFLLWICLTVNKFINKEYINSHIEVLAGTIVSVFYILLLLGKISI